MCRSEDEGKKKRGGSKKKLYAGETGVQAHQHTTVGSKDKAVTDHVSKNDSRRKSIEEEKGEGSKEEGKEELTHNKEQGEKKTGAADQKKGKGEV